MTKISKGFFIFLKNSNIKFKQLALFRSGQKSLYWKRWNDSFS